MAHGGKRMPHKGADAWTSNSPLMNVRHVGPRTERGPIFWGNKRSCLHIEGPE